MRTQASVLVHPSLLLNANQRLHWATKGEKTAALRFFGRQLGQQLQPVTGRVMVTFWFAMLDRSRRRDPQNWQPTTKALTDGITDAGVWPDDSSEWVKGPLIEFDEHLSPESAKRPPVTRRIKITVTLEEIG